ncbi:MAG: hypothetical protein U1E83_04955 [Methylotetracoccus sp.]
MGEISRVSSRGIALVSATIAMLSMSGCSSPGYNDNPSQKITDPRLGCPAETDSLTVYYTVHLQPVGDTEDARVTAERFRSYCDLLPGPGAVFLTVDLVGAESSREPIAVRVVERAPKSDEAGHPSGFEDLRPILEIPPQHYAKGVIEARFDVDHKGYYAIDLRRVVGDVAAAEVPLRIPLLVGVDPPEGARIARLADRALYLVGGACVLGYALFRFLRWRRRERSDAS